MLKFTNVLVKYGNVTAVNIPGPLEIKRGDVVGIIGENGAGKSTLLNAIIGEAPYSGEIEREFSLETLGIQFQQNSYNPLMTVREIIRMVFGRKFDSDLLDGIRRYELEPLLGSRIGKLSGGERQRLTLFLVLAVSKNPKSLYIFDELTTGLDFQKRQSMIELVRQRTATSTVLITTHYFEELSNWANKILILRRGRVVYFGSIDKLADEYPHDSVVKVSSDLALEEFNVETRAAVLAVVHPGGGSIGLVVKTANDRRIVSSYLEQYHLSYSVELCGLYSYCMLATARDSENSSV